METTDKMVEKEFSLGKTLGEGNYAEVKLATEKSTGFHWACKIINKKKLEPGDECVLGPGWRTCLQ